MRIERSYLAKITQQYEVDLTPEQVEDLYMADEIVVEAQLISDTFETIDDDDLTLRVVDKPGPAVPAKAQTLDVRLAEVRSLLDALVPDNVAHYAVEGLRRSVDTLRGELVKRPEGVVGQEE
jgi:hypothetical protein